MQWIDTVKNKIPDYSKDIKLNLEFTCLRSSIKPEDASAIALAAAVAAGNKTLIDIIKTEGNIAPDHLFAAQSAASIMAMNNIYYPFVEMTNDAEMKSIKPELRMTAYATFGGVDKKSFEIYALAASIVGKCHFCVANHYDLLKKEGLSLTELRDIGRIASVIYAVSKTIDL